MQQIHVTIKIHADDFQQKDLEALADAVAFTLSQGLVTGATFAGNDAEGLRRQYYVPPVEVEVAVSI